jgi:hypothetical protein
MRPVLRDGLFYACRQRHVGRKKGSPCLDTGGAKGSRRPQPRLLLLLDDLANLLDTGRVVQGGEVARVAAFG